jgi:uncharacterized protein YacL
MPNRTLIILRFLFVLSASLIGIYLVKFGPELTNPPWLQWLVLGGVIATSLALIALDVVVKHKPLDTISAVYFGMIVGLFLTYVVGLGMEGLPIIDKVKEAILLVLGMILCYGCISLLLQTKNDFRFVIPYVEFSKEVKGARPFVLDTSVVIDGRIADVVDTKILDAQVIMPRFVLNELQLIADSADRMRRSRGRRGLDILNRLRSSGIDLQIFDRELPEFAGQTVDLKLVLLAKHLGGKVVTNDYNLNKVAKLHGVGVVNLNDLANALKPVFLPGEMVEVRIVKPGEEAGQGVGYLDDGTMVVVENGREHLNRNVKIAVTSVLQTSAGRMVFGKYDSPAQGSKA